jgi:hypothetical protein
MDDIIYVMCLHERPVGIVERDQVEELRESGIEIIEARPSNSLTNADELLAAAKKVVDWIDWRGNVQPYRLRDLREAIDKYERGQNVR